MTGQTRTGQTSRGAGGGDRVAGGGGCGHGGLVAVCPGQGRQGLGSAGGGTASSAGADLGCRGRMDIHTHFELDGARVVAMMILLGKLYL